MKKILLFLFLFPIITRAQDLQFVLTPAGLKSASDTTKDYLVLEIPGKTKADLYTRMLLYLNKVYVSPKDVISKVENESITITGYASGVVQRNYYHVFDINYTVNCEFRDGKIRLNAPTFRLTNTQGPNLQKFLLVSNGGYGLEFGIWNTSLKLRHEKAKEDLENFFNTFTSRLIAGMKKEGDDW